MIIDKLHDIQSIPIVFKNLNIETYSHAKLCEIENEVYKFVIIRPMIFQCNVTHVCLDQVMAYCYHHCNLSSPQQKQSGQVVILLSFLNVVIDNIWFIKTNNRIRKEVLHDDKLIFFIVKLFNFFSVFNYILSI